MRRYSEMGQFYGMADGQIGKTLIVNTANPLVEKIKSLPDEKQKVAAKYIYSLALVSFKKLSPDELNDFVSESLNLLENFCN